MRVWEAVKFGGEFEISKITISDICFRGSGPAYILRESIG